MFWKGLGSKIIPWGEVILFFISKSPLDRRELRIESRLEMTRCSLTQVSALDVASW